MTYWYIVSREDADGKSPSVSRGDENITPTSSTVDPTIDNRSLLYQETWLVLLFLLFWLFHWYISICRPGKVCAFCNLGERSQLGQGSLLRLDWEKEFKPTLDEFIKQLVTKQLTPMPLQSPTAEMTPIVQYRRQKSAAKFK